MKDLKLEEVIEVSGGDINCGPDMYVTVGAEGSEQYSCDPLSDQGGPL